MFYYQIQQWIGSSGIKLTMCENISR